TNTLPTDSLRGVLLTRPDTNWTLTACPSPPTGWTATQSASSCLYTTPAGPNALAPGQTKSFLLTATTATGTADRTGVWGVTASKTDSFADLSQVSAASPA